VGCKPSYLYPADGDDCVSDEAVAVVHADDESHVFTARAEQSHAIRADDNATVTAQSLPILSGRERRGGSSRLLPALPRK